jgi:hypothetical protein
MFSSDFSEARDNFVILPPENAEVVVLLRSWFHDTSFFHSCEPLGISQEYGTLARLWVFGDAYSIPLLQNVAIDLMQRKIVTTGRLPDPETMTFVSANTMPSSILADFFAARLAPYTIYEYGPVQEVMLDDYRIEDSISRGDRIRQRAMMDSLDDDVCEWHIHNDDSEIISRPCITRFHTS